MTTEETKQAAIAILNNPDGKWALKLHDGRYRVTRRGNPYASPRHRRSFQSAISNRLTADWESSDTSADAEIYGALTSLRNRSRAEERNNGYIEAFFRELENNVVGPSGFRFTAKSKDPSGTPDKAANAAIEDHYKRWTQEPENYCVTGLLDETTADRLLVRAVARDGDCLIRIVRGYAGSAYRFALQPLEADHVDHCYNATLQNGNRIIMGVEVDPWGRPAAYHFGAAHPGDMYGTSYGASYGGNRERIPAADIIMPFISKRVGQNRGYPWAAAALFRMKRLNSYEDSEVIAAETASRKQGFLTSTLESGAEYSGPENAAEGGKYMDTSPGEIEQLPPGMEFKAWDPQHPAAQFSDFRKALLRGIASGLAVSYNTLANDLEGVNYSSLRDGKITERDAYKSLQAWWISTVKRKIFRAWLSHSLDFGLITMPNGGSLPAARFDKFANVIFQGRRWAWVDPLKEQQAAQLARKNGWKADGDIMAEQGYDRADVYEQIAADQAAAAELGLTFDHEIDPAEPPQVDTDQED